MSRTEALHEMVIEGTRLLLLEMPFTAWNERMLYEVRELEDNLRCTRPDRPHRSGTLRFQRGQWFWHMLEEMHALIQVQRLLFYRKAQPPPGAPPADR